MPYKDKDYEKLWMRKYLEANPRKRMLNAARSRSKLLGLEFNIDLEDIQIPEICPILNIPIKQKSFDGLHGPSDNSPSLDRIDTTKGYIKGNVKVISSKANQRKSDLTLEQIKRLHEYACSH